ncbi:LacI family DNA-binding transcriptional regulator [Methylobrevis pamukkalensis]|uniref:HTH-type transcriptional regulator DegA n=1 Tax=Methylobrevis pamukkalensis TaxID=1439726 RepID=A0A1E3H6C4_9HYPH|nr:LacI family DNA-binding transcriptional regulator [Methylobrevis pamukkalensis]ODN71877.1 HTH-type transcriptional regulator DegA [Methylobrevis pamukkalensis]
MGKVTIRDVAEAAGVSVATVDRVLNGRAGRTSRSAARVEEAIARLGYAPSALSARVGAAPGRFVFVLPAGSNPFVAGLADAVERLGDWMPFDAARYETLFVDVFDGPGLARILDGLDRNGLGGVSLVALDHPMVREAVNRLHDDGVPVVTLVSDLPGSRRSHYVGIDNIAAGRTAGSLMGRFLAGRPAEVAIVGGSFALRDHVERQLGFKQALSESYPAVTVVGMREGRDDGDATRRTVAALLAQYPGLAGIYSVGAGNAGIVEALKAAGRNRDMVFVAHELSADNRAALIAGVIDAVINQDCGHEIRSAARVMRALSARVPIVDAQERIRIDIFLAENLP